MGLRSKTWLVFGLVVLGLIAAVLVIVQVGVVRSLEGFEETAMRRDIHRALRAVDAEATHLDTVVLDWAVWDQSYDFLAAGDGEFVDGNLDDSTFRSLDLSLLAYMRLDGSVAWGRSYAAATARSEPLTPAAVSRLATLVGTLVRDDRVLRLRGVCVFADEPRLIALRPVLRGDGSGPPAGILAMGRTLGDEMVAHLGATLDLELTMTPFDAAPPGSDFARAAAALGARERFTTLPPDALTIAGFGLLRDVGGRPALILRAVQGREIAALGRAITRYLLVLLVAAVAVTALAVQLLLERKVISRLAALGDRMSEIGRLADTSARVAVDGGDEVGQLAAGINGMLAELESAETAVRTSEELYRAVVEDQAELICRWRPPGGIVFCNRSYARYFGAPFAGAAGHAPTALADVPRELVATAAALTREEPTATAVLGHHEGTRRRWVQWSSRALFDAAGALGEVQSVGRDVTRQQELLGSVEERARLTEALRDAQDAFLDLSRSLSGVVWIRAGDPPQVTYVNPAYERVWGRSCASLYDDAASFLLGVHPEDRAVAQRCGVSGCGGDGVECELRVVRPDGSLRWVHLRRFALGARAGDPAGERVFFVAEDISERKRIEAESKELQAQLRLLARRLDELREEERRRLAAWIHDEVGQMLTALRMNLAWLQQRLHPRAEAPRAAFAEMDAMIAANIAAVQRVTTELRPVILEDLGLLPAMEWAIGQVRRRTQARIEFRAALGDTAVDNGAALALFRILQEALTNVVRHAGATDVTVELAAADGAVSLRVADNGRGIRPEEAAGATALGILGMRERVLAHGGSLAIAPGPGGGTVLTAIIPT